MKEMTAREFMLLETLKEIRSKEMISINDIDKLMVEVHKLLMNYRDAIVSRDKWKKKYEYLREGMK